jgi:hypothetical protein
MFPGALNAGNAKKVFPHQIPNREKLRKVEKFRKIIFVKKLVIY